MQSNHSSSSPVAIAPGDLGDPVVYLLSAGEGEDARAALVMDTALPRTRNTLPCFYYWRKSARDGEWVNPERDFRIRVTPEMRREWQAAFMSRERDGDETPIVEDHNEKAASTLGYVKGVKQEGPWYWELHQYLGEEARDRALRNKISVAVKKNYQSNTGKKYAVAVQHSAITPRPTISGTGDAVALMGAGRAIYLSRAEGNVSEDSGVDGEVSAAGSGLSDRSENMSDKVLKCGESTLAALHEYVPGLGQVADDEKLSRMAQHLGTIRGVLKKLDVSDGDDGDVPAILARIEVRIDEAEKRASVAEGRLVELSRSEAAEKLTEREVYLLAKVADGEWASAVASGGVSPTILHELKGVFRREGGLLALSRAGSGGDSVEVELASILKRNRPAAVGERSGIQGASRMAPNDELGGEGKGELPFREMVARIGGGN